MASSPTFGSARPPVLFVARLYVRRDYQRRRLGTRLLDTLMTRHADMSRARLHVIDGNDAALKFYEACRYRRAGDLVEDGIRSICLERLIP